MDMHFDTVYSSMCSMFYLFQPKLCCSQVAYCSTFILCVVTEHCFQETRKANMFAHVLLHSSNVPLVVVQYAGTTTKHRWCFKGCPGNDTQRKQTPKNRARALSRMEKKRINCGWFYEKASAEWLKLHVGGEVICTLGVFGLQLCWQLEPTPK